MKSTRSLDATTLAALFLLWVPFLADGAEPLLIAVASEDKEATSLVSDQAARSQYYPLFDETSQLVQVVNNPFLSKGRGAAPLVVDYLARKGVGVVVAGRFGPVMTEAMNRKGLKYIPYSGVAQNAAERVINFLRPPKKDEKKSTQ